MRFLLCLLGLHKWKVAVAEFDGDYQLCRCCGLAKVTDVRGKTLFYVK